MKDRTADREEASIAAVRELRKNEPRKLSEEDELHLQRMAKYDVTSATAELVRLTLSERFRKRFEDDATADPWELLDTPELQPMLKQAVLKVWHWKTLEARLTQEFLDYLNEFADDRVWDIPLIEAEWEDYQLLEKGAVQGRKCLRQDNKFEENVHLCDK